MARPKRNKFTELFVYALNEFTEDDSCSDKLRLLLFNIDFSAYRRFGYSVTGQKYQAGNSLPIPQDFVPMLKAWTKDSLGLTHEPNKILERMKEEEHEEHTGLRKGTFSVEEQLIIENTILNFRDMSVEQIREELLRNFIGWDLAKEGETIPYSVALLGREELTEKQLEHAKIAEERARMWHAERAAT